MEDLERRLKIEHLRARLELSRIACAGLERDYYAGKLTLQEMSNIAERWGDALKIGHAARIELDRLGQE
jgi:hypothetical protein